MLQINSLFLWMLVLTFVFSSILQVRPEEGLEVQSNDHRETTISNLGTVRCFHRDSRKMVQLQLGYLTPYADRDAPLLHELILFIDVSKIPILKERNFSNGNKDKKIPYRGITIQKRTDPETREYDLEPYPLDKNFFSYNQAKSLTCGLKLIKITWYSEVLSTYLHPNHLTINRCIGSCDVGYTDVSTDEIFNIHSFSDSRRIY
ncbi:unnamed protein product [Gordionus sp. m RMFG-2023]